MFRKISILAVITLSSQLCFSETTDPDALRAAMMSMLNPPTNPVVVAPVRPQSNTNNQVRLPQILGPTPVTTITSTPVTTITSTPVTTITSTPVTTITSTPVTTITSTPVTPITSTPKPTVDTNNPNGVDLLKAQQVTHSFPLILPPPSLRPIVTATSSVPVSGSIADAPVTTSITDIIAIPPTIQPPVKTAPVLAPVLPPQIHPTQPVVTNVVKTIPKPVTPVEPDSLTFTPSPDTNSVDKPEADEVPTTQVLKQIKAQAKFDESLSAKATNELADILEQLEPTGQYVERYVRIPGGNNGEPRLVRTLIPVMRIKVK